jgi:hypothetical protein
MFKSKYFKIGTLLIVAIFGLIIGISINNANSTTTKPDTLIINGSIPYLTDQQLSATSPIIIEGDVSSILPGKWNTSDGAEPTNITGNDIIYTDNLIKVTKVLKGNLDPDSVIAVRTYGGEDTTSKIIKRVVCDEYGNFNAGEKVLLFLTYDDSNYNKNMSKDYYVLRGMNQGKYLIETDKVEGPHGIQSKSVLDNTILMFKNKEIIQPAQSGNLEK